MATPKKKKPTEEGTLITSRKTSADTRKGTKARMTPVERAQLDELVSKIDGGLFAGIIWVLGGDREGSAFNASGLVRTRNLERDHVIQLFFTTFEITPAEAMTVLAVMENAQEKEGEDTKS